MEFNYPQLTKHLAKSRSPQIILGGLIKKYWAPRQNLNPNEIKVISIMPCTSKKYEIRRPELEIDGLKPVDNVLTTRELAYLFRRQGINLAEMVSGKGKRFATKTPVPAITSGVLRGFGRPVRATAWALILLSAGIREKQLAGTVFRKD